MSGIIASYHTMFVALQVGRDREGLRMVLYDAAVGEIIKQTDIMLQVELRDTGCLSGGGGGGGGGGYPEGENGAWISLTRLQHRYLLHFPTVATMLKHHRQTLDIILAST